MTDHLRYNEIGANLGKPAVSLNWTKSYVTVVGERSQVWLPMPRDSLQNVSHLSFWEYHDTLYHADKEYPGEQTCEACERLEEMGLK